MNKIKYFFIVTFLFVSISVNTVLASDESEIIKIGYAYNFGTIKDPLIQYSEGFGYEYFEEISKYTGHKYKYMICNWEDGFDMLESGEIDIFGPATKTDERMENYLYSDIPFGNERVIISSLADSEYMYEDFEAMNGQRIRIESDGSEIIILEEYMEENNLDLEFIYSNDMSDVEGMKNDLYDLSLTSSLYYTDELKVNAALSVEPFYYVTNKNNQKLMEEIDLAIEKITSNNFLFAYELYDKYYGSAAVAKPQLSAEDINLLTEEKTFKVGYNTEYDPIQFIGDDNSPQGVSIQIMELLTENTGISFEYVPLELATKEEILDLDISLDNSSECSNGSMSRKSEPYAQITLVSIMKSNGKKSESKNIGMTRYYYIPPNTMSNIMPNARIKPYESLDSLVKSLNKGELDGTIANELACNLILKEIDTQEFATHSLDVEFPLNLQFSDSMSEEYVTLFNKLIERLDKKAVEAIFFDSSNYIKDEITFSEFLSENILELALVILVFIIIVLLAIAITARAKRKALNEVINKDALTGLLTEYKFIQNMKEILLKANDNEYELIYLDVDNFQYINEVYGYANGSLVLKYLSEQLVDFFGESALIARSNADRFIALKKKQPSTDGKSNQSYFKWDINFKLMGILGENYVLNISQGIYEISDIGLDITYMIDCARSARRLSKGVYGHAVSIFTDELEYDRNGRNKILIKMEQALVNREFVVFYQAKMNLNSHKIIGAEALVRWISPTEGLIGPDDFIPLFEENGFIKKIDMFVFEEVCKFIAEYRELLKDITISSNLSNITLVDDDLIDSLLAITDKYKISPSCLELEITESAIAGNANNLIDKITELKKLGFLIAMDDFGSGVSSLNRLKNIDIDIIKIDREFLMDTLDGDKGIVIIENVINLAKNLNLFIIAEGVETKEHVDLLTKLNCDYAQGYYFSKPICKTDFIEIVKNPPKYQ